MTGPNGEGELVLRNRGETPVDYYTGTVTTGRLVNDAGEVVGMHIWPTTLIGLGGELAPGAEFRTKVVFGTASCAAKIGFVTPPGHYRLVAGLELDGEFVEADGPVEVIRP